MSKNNEKQLERRTRIKRILKAVFRPRLLVTIAAIVAGVIGWSLVSAHLPDLSQQDAYRITPADITINEPPYWVPHDLIEDVVERAGFPDEMSLLDEELTLNVSQAFAHHPWVADVQEVRKASYPPRLTVTLKYRVPVAMIEKRSGLYPVDANGILLPVEDFSLSDTADYLKIAGVLSAPPSLQGDQWDDPLVLGAARMAHALRKEWKQLDLRAIGVPERRTENVSLEESEFSLLTNGGSAILWGRAPGIDQPGELTVEQKVGRLKKYLSDFGSFDEPAGPYEIDIRHWQQISRKKLPAARDAKNAPAALR
jgi:hypothetical protein